MSPTAATEVRRPTTTKRIVVADDDPDMLAWIATPLRMEGYTVTEVGSGDALLDCIADALLKPRQITRPDLIICDVKMPEFTGLDVLAGLRRGHWKLPFIMISASNDPSLEREAKAWGAHAFLHKPFAMTVLRKLIRNATD